MDLGPGRRGGWRNCSQDVRCEKRIEEEGRKKMMMMKHSSSRDCCYCPPYTAIFLDSSATLDSASKTKIS